MNIISHRGYWLSPKEKNAASALQRSFDKYFGTETALRDMNCQLVISHDMATKDVLPFSDLLNILDHCPLQLALNIKSNDVSDTLFSVTHRYENIDYFVFDMSIPDMRQYLDHGMPVYGRVSDVERDIPWQEECKGIWLDVFQSIWYTQEILESLLVLKKYVWNLLKMFSRHPNFSLCTDIPEKALEYFGGSYD